MTSKLRLLLDECIQAPLAEEIKKCSGVASAVWVSPTDLASYANRKTTDKALVDYATSQQRILVTIEGRLNERNFPVCSHSGIIIIKAAIHHELMKAQLFTRFMRSGHRSKSRHAVTKLRLERSTRIEIGPDGNPQEVEVPIPH